MFSFGDRFKARGYVDLYNLCSSAHLNQNNRHWRIRFSCDIGRERIEYRLQAAGFGPKRRLRAVLYTLSSDRCNFIQCAGAGDIDQAPQSLRSTIQASLGRCVTNISPRLIQPFTPSSMFESDVTTI